MITAAPDYPDPVAIGDKVGFMPAMPGGVQVIVPHLACAVLTAEDAFKRQKPVSLGYGDPRPLAARVAACAERARGTGHLRGLSISGRLPWCGRARALRLGGQAGGRASGPHARAARRQDAGCADHDLAGLTAARRS